MNGVPSSATELARNLPLTGGALYLTFISQYGAAIVTTMAIVYGAMQIYMRWKEHRAIMRKNKENTDGSE